MATQVNDFTVTCRIKNYHLRFHLPDYYLDSVEYLMDTMEQTKWTLRLDPCHSKEKSSLCFRRRWSRCTISGLRILFHPIRWVMDKSGKTIQNSIQERLLQRTGATAAAGKRKKQATHLVSPVYVCEQMSVDDDLHVFPVMTSLHDSLSSL
ncbi:hypothetical protein CEXT_283181 [Caerostris extrusa]|uniref:Uncharacterized protein n=1 Tax=Caerostris extrusa TaxID=172846 RepID=A0AAV4UTZ2_CAEEX|nr:hypothetical protein CEXT_283181 [Caerostris extrusa]